LKLKLNLLNLVLKIIENKKNIKSSEDFIEVCNLVDKTKDMTFSKKIFITSKTVINYLKEKNKNL
jgi:hypothetical protein